MVGADARAQGYRESPGPGFLLPSLAMHAGHSVFQSQRCNPLTAFHWAPHLVKRWPRSRLPGSFTEGLPALMVGPDPAFRRTPDRVAIALQPVGRTMDTSPMEFNPTCIVHRMSPPFSDRTGPGHRATCRREGVFLETLGRTGSAGGRMARCQAPPSSRMPGLVAVSD